MNRPNTPPNSRYIDEYGQPGYYDPRGPVGPGAYPPGQHYPGYDYQQAYDQQPYGAPPGYYDTYDRELYVPYDEDESDGDDLDIGTTKRLHALDIARGIFLIISVGTASVITNPLPHWHTHADWYGVTLYDLIFPVFVVLSGMGFAFAYKNGVKWGVTFRRAIVLAVVGLLYNVVTYQTYSLHSIRLTGVLQLYAVLTLVLGPAHLVLRNWKAWLVFTALLAGGYTWFLTMWPATYCNVDALTYACNPSGFVDTYVFGANHLWAGGQFGHDPEGLIAALGALITASAGTTLGHFFVADNAYRTARDIAVEQAAYTPYPTAQEGETGTSAAVHTDEGSSTSTGEPAGKTKKGKRGKQAAKDKANREPDFLADLGPAPKIYTPSIILLIVLAGGIGLSFVVPAFKRLWTPSFGLLAAVFGLALVTVLWLFFDRFEHRIALALSYPLISLGRNALLVYFGSHLLFTVLMRMDKLPVQIGTAISADHPALAFVGVSILAWTLLSMILHRAAIYVHA